MRTVVVGASSGLGRCIGIGLAQRGGQVALMARRADKLETAAKEAGERAVPITCDVTDAASCRASHQHRRRRAGWDRQVVYAPAVGPLARIEELDADTWRATFDTNVIGASLFTAAALPHLNASAGRVVYLSSVSASQTAPWPGLGAYAVSKAALDKLVEAWRAEHPEVGFTRLVVGDCPGGEGDGLTQFANGVGSRPGRRDGRALGEPWPARRIVRGRRGPHRRRRRRPHAGPSVSMSTVIVSPPPHRPRQLRSALRIPLELGSERRY